MLVSCWCAFFVSGCVCFSSAVVSCWCLFLVGAVWARFIYLFRWLFFVGDCVFWWLFLVDACFFLLVVFFLGGCVLFVVVCCW